MTVEVRPIERDEAVAYLQVLPFANGLPHWEPAPAAWHGGVGAWPQPNQPASRDQLERWADEMMADPAFHPQAAFVDGRLVGGSAMLSLQVTVPGPAPVPMGGVTATGVIATHRRRGLLRLMMQAMFDDALARGEVLAGLSASEGSIYGRFGFSPATLRTRWDLDRTQAAFRSTDQPSGSLELVTADVAREAWPALHEQARTRRVGEVSALHDRWATLTDTARDTAGPMRYVVHRDDTGRVDGIANYRLPWSDRVEHTGTLVVEALEAVTPAAYEALWRLLTDFDLTNKVAAPGRPADEPLRWMLANPRAMRVTRQSDNLWLRLLDVPRAMQARSYAADISLVVEVDRDPMCPHNLGRWKLDASPTGATCTRVDGPPDLTTDVQALSSLYLGGASASTLATAGRIQVHSEHALQKLGLALHNDPPPFNSIVF